MVVKTCGAPGPASRCMRKRTVINGIHTLPKQCPNSAQTHSPQFACICNCFCNRPISCSSLSSPDEQPRHPTQLRSDWFDAFFKWNVDAQTTRDRSTERRISRSKNIQKKEIVSFFLAGCLCSTYSLRRHRLDASLLLAVRVHVTGLGGMSWRQALQRGQKRKNAWALG